MNEFHVTEDRRVILNGVEITKVAGFRVDIEACSDPIVEIRIMADSVTIDGYTDAYADVRSKRKE